LSLPQSFRASHLKYECKGNDREKGGDWRRRWNDNDLEKGGDWRQNPSIMVGEEKEKDKTAR